MGQPKETKKKRDRNEAARRKQTVKEHMKLPVNQFLNDAEKFPVAKKLRQYFLNNPDPILDDVRRINAMVHNIRHHKDQARKCLEQYTGNDRIDITDEHGRYLTKPEVYSRYVVEYQSVYTDLSRLREALISMLLPKVDGDLLTFQQYNDYVLKVEDLIKKLGYELFPEELELIDPK